MNTFLAAVLLTGVIMTAGGEEGQGFQKGDIEFVRGLCLEAKLTEIYITRNEENGEVVQIECKKEEDKPNV